ncbi:MAG: hypothetical protein LM517_08710 [Nitrosomonas sp.]|nr:hypothetical protein [Nitrosomonas sp.]
MKINILVDSSGVIVGAARSAIPTKGSKAGTSGFEAGMVGSPGQNVHEVEVPEKLAELDGQELLRKLSEVDSVKKVLSTVVTAGQGK